MFTKTGCIEVDTGKKKVIYNNWREVKVGALGVKPEFSYTKSMIIDKLKKKYNNAKITCVEFNGVIGKKNNTIIEADTMLDMAKKTGLSKATVTKYCEIGKTINGWVFKRRVKKEVF